MAEATGATVVVARESEKQGRLFAGASVVTALCPRGSHGRFRAYVGPSVLIYLRLSGISGDERNFLTLLCDSMLCLGRRQNSSVIFKNPIMFKNPPGHCTSKNPVLLGAVAGSVTLHALSCTSSCGELSASAAGDISVVSGQCGAFVNVCPLWTVWNEYTIKTYRTSSRGRVV